MVGNNGATPPPDARDAYRWLVTRHIDRLLVALSMGRDPSGLIEALIAIVSPYLPEDLNQGLEQQEPLRARLVQLGRIVDTLHGEGLLGYREQPMFEV